MKTTKSVDRFLSAGVLAVSLMSAAAWSAELTLTADKTASGIEESVTVTVNVKNAAPFAHWQVCVKFDGTKLELTAQAAGDFAVFISDSRSLAEINASGEIRSGGFGFADNGGGNGRLGVFTFKVLVQEPTQLTSENKSGSNPFGNVLKTAGGAETLPTVGETLRVNGDSAPKQYVLTATKAGSGDGEITLNPAGGTYNAGAEVTLTATAATGSVFAGWSGAASGTANSATVTMDDNKAVTATFTLQSSDGNGNGDGNGDGNGNGDGESDEGTNGGGSGGGSGGGDGGGSETGGEDANNGGSGGTGGTDGGNETGGEGGVTAPKLEVLNVKKALIRLKFNAAGKDAVVIQGTLPISAGFIVAGKTVIVDIGGIKQEFGLNAKGQANGASERFRLQIKRKKGAVVAQQAKFQLQLKNGDFAQALSAAGLTNADIWKASVTVPVLLTFDGTTYATDASLSYSAKADKTGLAK
jgi:hypothetical protein